LVGQELVSCLVVETKGQVLLTGRGGAEGETIGAGAVLRLSVSVCDGRLLKPAFGGEEAEAGKVELGAHRAGVSVHQGAEDLLNRAFDSEVTEPVDVYLEAGGFLCCHAVEVARDLGFREQLLVSERVLHESESFLVQLFELLPGLEKGRVLPANDVGVLTGG